MVGRVFPTEFFMPQHNLQAAIGGIAAMLRLPPPATLKIPSPRLNFLPII
jgi:hypothetical protein